MANIAVIGAGGWGTALAVMAHQYGNTVSLWSPFEEEVAAIRRHDEHKKLLPGVAVPPSIRLTTNIACAAGADLVIMAVPSFAIRSTAARLADVVKPATIIANAGKGLKVQGWMKPVFRYVVPAVIIFLYIYGMVHFSWR